MKLVWSGVRTQMHWTTKCFCLAHPSGPTSPERRNVWNALRNGHKIVIIRRYLKISEDSDSNMNSISMVYLKKNDENVSRPGNRQLRKIVFCCTGQRLAGACRCNWLSSKASTWDLVPDICAVHAAHPVTPSHCEPRPWTSWTHW